MIDLLLSEPIMKLIEQWPTLAVMGVVAWRLEQRMGACFEMMHSIIKDLLEHD